MADAMKAIGQAVDEEAAADELVRIERHQPGRVAVTIDDAIEEALLRVVEPGAIAAAVEAEAQAAMEDAKSCPNTAAIGRLTRRSCVHDTVTTSSILSPRKRVTEYSIGRPESWSALTPLTHNT